MGDIIRSYRSNVGCITLLRWAILNFESEIVHLPFFPLVRKLTVNWSDHKDVFNVPELCVIYEKIDVSIYQI